MRLQINGCVGCGFCYLIWQKWFYGIGNERAAARKVEIPESERDEVQKAIQQCPAQAISIKNKRNKNEFLRLFCSRRKRK